MPPRPVGRARRPVVLCLNAGSSSLKLALYRLAARPERLAHGAVEGIGQPRGRVRLAMADGRTTEQPRAVQGLREAAEAALDWLGERGLPEPDAVGHRLVHGGPDYAAPVVLDARVMARLRRLIPLAPLHLPGELAVVDAVRARAPRLVQVACFDTAFHRTLPDVARYFALPARLGAAGIRRYGFHGLSYEYVLWRLGRAGGGRLVIAHLGNGASLAAVRGRRSVDTTMGLTPTGGIPMGTRSGDLDPGVLVHLLQHRGYDAAGLERLVNREAGLLGVSGSSSDMAVLLRARRRPEARLAVAMFCYRARMAIGGLAAAMGGLDTLVFTGGIGERAAPVRALICRGLQHLGVVLDPGRNAAHAGVISGRGSRATVRVVPTDEEWMIARHVQQALGRVRASGSGASC